MSESEIDDAEAAGIDELLALDAIVLPERDKLTIDELAAKVDTDVQVVRAFWRALGFVEPAEGERNFGRRDVAILKSLVAVTREGLVDPELGLQVARVLGVSMAQVATAVIDAGEARSDERRRKEDADQATVGDQDRDKRDHDKGDHDKRDDDGRHDDKRDHDKRDDDGRHDEKRDHDKRDDERHDDERRDDKDDDIGSLAVRAKELVPFLADVVDYALRRHLRAAARRRVAVASTDDDVGQVVGFADLVRFTELSSQLDDRDLARVVARFDELVNSTVIRHGGRIVKMIGDAAMFTVLDPVDAGLVALEMSDAIAADEVLSGLRVGMANGTVLAHDGDLYGPVVNTASRLVTIGRAGAINVTKEIRDALSGDGRFALRSLGVRSLRHIGDIRVYRLRPGPTWQSSSIHEQPVSDRSGEGSPVAG